MFGNLKECYREHYKMETELKMPQGTIQTTVGKQSHGIYQDDLGGECGINVKGQREVEGRCCSGEEPLWFLKMGQKKKIDKLYVFEIKK